MTDTSDAAVERLAAAIMWETKVPHALRCTFAVTLRALRDERAALRVELRIEEEMHSATLVERDDAQAEAARLREALEGVVDSATPLIDYSGPGYYPVSRGEFRVEGDAMDAARAALAGEQRA